MKKIVLAIDSFKGSLSSLELCDIGKEKIKSINPDIEVISIPIADGGEGTVEALSKAMEGEFVHVKSIDLNFKEIHSYYYRSGNMAIIEMANCAGLHLSEENNPMKTTTIGVGVQIRDAIEKGATKIILGLGGSGTNDGGCGCAHSLGMKFYNKKGEEFIPTGENLKEIHLFEDKELRQLLKGIEVVALCDVNNPLYGEMGAASIYGPQKGADENMVEELDQNLIHLANIIKEMSKKDIAVVEGSGAAGGMGAGVISFLGGELKRGIDTILEITNFEDKIKDADLILTGEGRVDEQSLMGKVISGICTIAQEKKIPVAVICAIVGEGYEKVYNHGVIGVFVTNKMSLPFEEAKKRAKKDAKTTFEDIINLLNIKTTL